MGTIVNVIAIILASFIGVLFKKKLSLTIQKSVLFALGIGLFTLSIGWFISDFIISTPEGFATHKELLIILSLVIGTLIGTALKLEERFSAFVFRIEEKYKWPPVAKGFITASIIFCVGAMAIIGSIQDGLYGNPEVLYIKSALDFVTAIMLASSLGIGVIFSSISVGLYQGVLTLLSGQLDTLLTTDIITSMSMVGNILLIAIAIDFMEIKKVKVLNMLPAIFIPIIYGLIMMIL